MLRVVRFLFQLSLKFNHFKDILLEIIAGSSSSNIRGVEGNHQLIRIGKNVREWMPHATPSNPLFILHSGFNKMLNILNLIIFCDPFVVWTKGVENLFIRNRNILWTINELCSFCVRFSKETQKIRALQILAVQYSHLL